MRRAASLPSASRRLLVDHLFPVTEFLALTRLDDSLLRESLHCPLEYIAIKSYEVPLRECGPPDCQK